MAYGIRRNCRVSAAGRGNGRMEFSVAVVPKIFSRGQLATFRIYFRKKKAQWAWGEICKCSKDHCWKLSKKLPLPLTWGRGGVIFLKPLETKTKNPTGTTNTKDTRKGTSFESGGVFLTIKIFSSCKPTNATRAPLKALPVCRHEGNWSRWVVFENEMSSSGVWGVVAGKVKGSWGSWKRAGFRFAASQVFQGLS